TVGKVAMVPENAPPFVCSPQTTFWRVLDDSTLDRWYLYAFLRGPLFSAQLNARKSETDMADYVSLTTQRQLTVFIPDISRQRWIGSTIRFLEERINVLIDQNSVLESIARA